MLILSLILTSDAKDTKNCEDLEQTICSLVVYLINI